MSVPAGTDTASPEWQLICLARHICRMPTKQHRHEFLALMRKRGKNDQFIAEVEKKVREQWAQVRAEITAKANG